MPNENVPFTVGLTGPIGAGKSTVATLLAAKGVPVIDADVLGREVWETSAELKAALKEAFGPAILAADGAIDRRALAREAFASEATTERLNEIVHPFLWKRIKAEIAAYGDAPLVVVDAALVVEWRDHLSFDAIVIVDAPEDVRRERSRAKYDEGDFSARQARQLSADAKRAAADIILDNSGPEAALATKVDILYNILCKMARGEPPAGTPIIE